MDAALPKCYNFWEIYLWMCRVFGGLTAMGNYVFFLQNSLHGTRTRVRGVVPGFVRNQASVRHK